MQAIWKYPIPAIDMFHLDIPEGGKPLAVHVQRGQPCMWVQVTPDAPMTLRIFAIYGTGHQMPDDPGTFIGTYLVDGGALVFHLFEISR